MDQKKRNSREQTSVQDRPEVAPCGFRLPRSPQSPDQDNGEQEPTEQSRAEQTKPGMGCVRDPEEIDDADTEQAARCGSQNHAGEMKDEWPSAPTGARLGLASGVRLRRAGRRGTPETERSAEQKDGPDEGDGRGGTESSTAMHGDGRILRGAEPGNPLFPGGCPDQSRNHQIQKGQRCPLHSQAG
jgi:hypothetical protein